MEEESSADAYQTDRRNHCLSRPWVSVWKLLHLMFAKLILAALELLPEVNDLNHLVTKGPP